MTILLSSSTNHPGYPTTSNPIQQSNRRKLPDVPQQNISSGSYSEVSIRCNLSANDYVDRHGNYQQDSTQLGVSTSGRTTPTIILDNSASENQNRFANLECVKFINIRSNILRKLLEIYKFLGKIK